MTDAQAATALAGGGAKWYILKNNLRFYGCTTPGELSQRHIDMLVDAARGRRK
jgi:hypothetical protein